MSGRLVTERDAVAIAFVTGNLGRGIRTTNYSRKNSETPTTEITAPTTPLSVILSWKK